MTARFAETVIVQFSIVALATRRHLAREQILFFDGNHPSAIAATFPKPRFRLHGVLCCVILICGEYSLSSRDFHSIRSSDVLGVHSCAHSFDRDAWRTWPRTTPSRPAVRRRPAERQTLARWHPPHPPRRRHRA